MTDEEYYEFIQPYEDAKQMAMENSDVAKMLDIDLSKEPAPVPAEEN